MQQPAAFMTSLVSCGRASCDDFLSTVIPPCWCFAVAAWRWLQPKDDRKHRAAWRELYTPAELAELADLAAHCRSRGVRMLYGIGASLLQFG